MTSKEGKATLKPWVADKTELTGPSTAPSPELRRVSAAGQRPTAPRAGAPSRDALRPGATAERHDKAPTSAVAAPPRGRALPSVRAYVAGLTLLLGLAAQPAVADVLGIPLERQPFIKFCPDGSIVGSLGANRPDQPSDQYGAFAYDRQTDRTTFLKRSPDFEERLAANPCVKQPVGRKSR